MLHVPYIIYHIPIELKLLKHMVSRILWLFNVFNMDNTVGTHSFASGL